MQGYIPLPWQAFYEFCRQIYTGCTVTFRPQPTSKAMQIVKPTTNRAANRIVTADQGMRWPALRRATDFE
jgi:hypothetical protein